MLRQFSLPVAVLYTTVLSLLSLIKLNINAPSLPTFSDKVFHALAHILFVVFWFLVFNCRFKFKFNKAIQYAVLLSFAYGLLIELFQGLITISRQSELNDVIANVIGALLAALLLLSLKKGMLKNNNTFHF